MKRICIIYSFMGLFILFNDIFASEMSPMIELEQKNHRILQLIDEATFEWQSIIHRAEYIKEMWKKGKNISRLLRGLKEEEVHNRNSANFVEWMKAGGQPITSLTKYNSPPYAPQLVETYQRNRELNLLLQEARREIFSIAVIARYALDEVNYPDVLKYYMIIIGKDGRYGGGQHAEGVRNFMKLLRTRKVLN